MARITPPTNSKNHGLPSWMNGESIINAGKGVLDRVRGLTKTASQEKIASVYACPNCLKKFGASHKHFVNQKTAGTELTCPNCNHTGVTAVEFVVATNKVSNLQSISAEKRTDLEKEATIDAFLDRHFVAKATQALSDFASHQGMYGAVAKYQKAEHSKIAGADISTLNNMEFKIEWVYGRRQKAFVTASVKVDPAGKFIMPKIFKDASGKEYAFEVDSIRSMEKETSMREPVMIRRKSDIPVFKKTDPSNFKAV